MFKVILWDVDGTLFNFEKSEKYAIRQCFSKFNMGECTDEMIYRYAAINSSYWKRMEAGEITKEQVLLGRFSEFFSSENIYCPNVSAFNDEYQIRLGDKVFFNDNCCQLIRRLKGKMKQYVVTNGTYVAQKRKLERSGLRDDFDGIFISEEIGIEKPNVGFFEYIWKQIGYFEKEDIVIVGDSLTSDMQGGNNAGIRCCWYNPERKENNTDVRIDYQIQNLNEIENL